MIIYLFFFIVSLLCYKISINTRDKFISYFFLILSITMLSLLAGFRDDTVGTDLQLYGVTCWNDCSNIGSITEVLGYALLTNNEIGYVFFNFCVGKITKDLHVFLFFHQFVISTIFFVVAYRLKESKYSIFIIASFLLTLYVQSFNLLRQSMAIAIVFLAFYEYFICNRRLIPFIITICAMLFHNSIVFAIFLPILHNFVNGISNKKIYIIAIISTAICISSFSSIIVNLLNFGLLSNKYENYVSQTGYSSHKADIGLFMLIFSLLLYFKSKYKILNTQNYNFIMICTFISICLLFMGDVTEVANRVAVYYSLPLFFVFRHMNLTEGNLKLLFRSIVFAMFVVWLYSASLGFSECVPYSSKNLGEICGAFFE